MSTHRSSRIFLLSIAAVTILVMIAIWWRPRGGSQLPEGSPAQRDIPSPGPIAKERAAANSGPMADPLQLLRDPARELNRAQNGEQARESLAKLRAALRSLGSPAATAKIVELLDSKVDAPSHLEFAVGPDGFLKQPSSLRVFLLDELGQIDPKAAADYAEKILASKDSPDEWAVSLRNYALGRNADGLPFLRNKVREMIHHEPWQKDPSVGFLEAFDVAVFAGGTDLVPDLTELLRQKENRAVAHASYLSMDRLVIRQPAAMLEQLQREPELMAGREETRANYFARANVSDPAQKALVENYLLDPRHSAAELDKFAGIFPSGNFMISHNLLTRSTTPSGDMLATQDRAALQVVEGWLTDPRFQKVESTLKSMRIRIAEFVRQGNSPAK